MCEIAGTLKMNMTIAGSKLCSRLAVLGEEVLNFGQKDCRLSRPSPVELGGIATGIFG